MMRTALSAFIYLNYPLDEAIRRIAAAGYDGVDIWGGRPHAYRRDLAPADTARLKSVLAAAGLGVASFIPAQFRYPTCLCSNNDGIRRDSVDYINDSLETAARLGAPVVSVCPGHTIFGQTVADGWQRLADSLAKICDHAQPYGVKIAIEPADRYETDLMATTADAMRLVHQIGAPNLGVVLDTGHAHVAGESFESAMAAMGDRLFHVHIDDNNGQRDQHLIPGDGTVDLPGCIGQLKASGYNGYLSAELSWDFTLDPGAAAQAALARIKLLLAGQALRTP
jgi:protein FrlC